MTQQQQFSITQDHFKGKWIRIHSETLVTFDYAALEQVIVEQEKFGAVYIAFTHQQLQGTIIQHLQQQYQFQFYYGTQKEVVYYKWCNKLVENKVPPYASSIQGVNVIVLSPDEQFIIMVRAKNRKMWQFVSGAVDGTENSLDAAKREVQEETGIAIDSSKGYHLLFASRITCARFATIGDNILGLVMYAKEKSTIQMDANELDDAAWLPVNDLLQNKYELTSFFNMHKLIENVHQKKWFSVQQLDAKKLVFFAE